MHHKIALLTVQKWGNSLAIRIPAAIARSAHLHLGTLVELDAHHDHLLIKASGKKKLTLNERLNAFNAEKHGGEAMPTKPIGLESLTPLPSENE